jgi:Dolichyl-phosphate-mannose-protein mannosyltransferase
MSDVAPATSGSAFAGPRAIPIPRTVALAVGIAILAVAGSALAVFYSQGVTFIYGDALAHMEGARRLTDSLTPGYEEIGSVWLPLYHLLVAPLATNDWLWRTGLGGSFVSLAAFCVTAWLLFRLATEMSGTLAAGVVALAGFLFCPSMLYLASMPMTEPLTMLWAVATVYALFRFSQSGRRSALLAAAVAAFLGTMTRYDGWFLLPFASLYVLLARGRDWKSRFSDAAIFGAISGFGPALWAVHNFHRFGNPLEFYNGRYSAKAIYAHQLATTGFRYPTDGSLLLSLRYYVEDMKLVIGAWPLELALLGLVAWCAMGGWRARRSAGLLLLVPLVFYVQSMAHAAIPIYVPTLFPHTYYNLRYGLEMLPGIAVLASFLFTSSLPRRACGALLVLALGFLIAPDVASWARGVDQLPIVRESLLNTPCATRTEQALIDFFRTRYDGRVILMGLGQHPCFAFRTGIPYRQTLTEANRPYWRLIPLGPAHWPSTGPLASLEWIIRGDSDIVDELMRAHPEAFTDFVPVAGFHFPGEEGVTIYRRVR